MARAVISICVLLLALSGWCNEANRNSGRLNGFHNGGIRGDRGIQFNYVVDFRLWTMMNEPVYNVKFTWSFDERARIEENPFNYIFGNSDSPLNVLLSEIDSDLRDSIRPYKVIVRINGHLQGNKHALYHVEWDVGVPGASGSTSYNTPASPEWNSLFYANGFSDKFISEEEAKQVLRTGFIATDVRILRVEWRLDEYYRSIEKQNYSARRKALNWALQRHLFTLENIQKLPTKNLQDTIDRALREAEVLRNKGVFNYLSPLEKLLNRFDEGLPPSMRNGVLEEPYEQALAEIRKEYQLRVTSPAGNSDFFSDYDKWLQDKKMELGARKQIAMEMRPFRNSSDRCGFKDEYGNTLVPPRYHTCHSAGNGFGIINPENNDGSYTRTNTGSWGVIDQNGNMVIPAKYIYIEADSDIKTDNILFKVTLNHWYTGSCSSSERHATIQKMNGSGEAVGDSYTETSAFVDTSCYRPIILRRN